MSFPCCRLHPMHGRAKSMAAQSGRSRHTYSSLAAHRPWRAALASRPRRVLQCVIRHASVGSRPPPTPLQRRLAEAGVTDWQAFCQPRYDTLTSDLEVASIAAKIVELCKEGLAAGDSERLFQQQNSPRTSNLQQVFLPNMAYLRGLLAGERIVTAPYEPSGLTPLGRLLRNQPSALGLLLSRSPALTAELEAWLSDELGLSRKQLAQKVLQQPNILQLSVGTAKSVLTFFTAKLDLSLNQAVDLLLRYNTLFSTSPDTLAGKCSQLAQLLNISSVRALVVKVPRVLIVDITQLPSTLRALDAFMGQDGAGVQAVLKAPILAHRSPLKIERAVQQLINLGLDMGAVRELVSVDPDVLVKDLEGPVQQQKLQWAQEQLGWSLAKLLRAKLFSRSLIRMSSRLAFMRHVGLPDPGSLAYIGNASEPVFLARVGKAVGREISAREFSEWVAAWLQTPEGRRWGFTPEKPKRARQPKG